MRIDDVHAIEIEVPPEAVWAALPPTLERSFAGPRAERVAKLLGCRETRSTGRLPEAGATIPGFRASAAEAPRRLALEGRHRFSEYELAFEIEPTPRGSVVRAVTHARFPGFKGALYRGMLLFAHGPATRRILRSLARRAGRITRSPKPGTP